MAVDLTNLQKALKRLEQALKRLQHERSKEVAEQDTDADLMDMLQESLTQRFEFTIEQAWKAMQRVLEQDADGKVATEARKGSRSTLRLSYEKGWIDDFAQWDELVNLRNLASHNYDERIPAQIAQRVPNALPLLKQALQHLEQHIQTMPKT